MKRRAETRQGAQGGSTATRPLAQVLGPLVTGMTATRQSLLEWIHAVGLSALDAVFRQEATALAGPKGRHAPGRTHHHWGRTGRDLTFGGRLSVACPRVRSPERREATLPSVAVFRARDPLTTRVMEQLLLGVSARGYARSLEGWPGARPSRGSRKSAVSRVDRPGHVARGQWHADAAAGLREGLDETLTVLKLELPPILRRFFATTNGIENLIGTLRHVARHVQRWRGAT